MTDRVRAMLLAWTVLATGGWVVSAFAVDGLVSSPSSRPGLPAVFWLALGIELAAVAGWLGLGVALWWRARRCGGLGAWADLCLRTMSVGSVPLAVAGAATAGMGWSDAEMPGGWAAFLGMHGVALLLSGGVMTAVFVRGGRRLGASVGEVLGLWIGVLHGVFAGAFAGLGVVLGYWGWLVGAG